MFLPDPEGKYPAAIWIFIWLIILMVIGALYHGR
jgi:hypothetical protein